MEANKKRGHKTLKIIGIMGYSQAVQLIHSF